MPLTWNGVIFHEACPDSPEGSVMPAQESRMTINGWFSWNDLVTQAASKAYLGYNSVQTNYVPLDLSGNAIPPGQLNLLLNPQTPYLHCVNPLAHPDWGGGPNGPQFYLAEGFTPFKGFVPGSPAIGPNQAAVFNEAHVTLSFRSPKNGYRCLPDILTLDMAVGAPREYFLLRNCEFTDKATVRSQTIPADAGLQWQALQGNGQPGGPGNGINVAAANFITLHEGELTLKLGPWPLDFYNEPAALDLVGKCNNAAFPPTQPQIPGFQPPRSLMGQHAGQKALATLVWGLPSKEVVRQGDLSYAYQVTYHLKHFAYGANAFFWWNPPPGTRGRIRIDPTNGPTPDPTLGGPGYYPVQRPDGTLLFPPGDFTKAFLPRGAQA